MEEDCFLWFNPDYLIHGCKSKWLKCPFILIPFVTIYAPFGTALSSWFSGRIRGAVLNAVESEEVILGWFWEVILWNKLRSWELKKVTSSDSDKWFSVLILKIYHKESLSVTESRRIGS
jgi:hypothetical protein